uniref:Transcriptional regulator ICP22 homolog n=1 Tax=Equid alphaherpesvirus 1 TaxID=10326 RepID=Q86970_9ALPH|nr:ICP22/ICP27 [Equid alphaherpesvirus 1]ABD24099.1 IR4/UL5 fusion protein 1 [Equid alphaherpesvirus 1]ABD24103.1 IR4/UL5 fusion protein 1 [Equid alphaherpesvirus 1]
MPHGQPCGACDGSCRMAQRGTPSTSPLIPSLTPSPPAGDPSPRSSQRIDAVRVPARLPGGSDHPEYGMPLSPRALRPYLARGPGAFCAPPWRPDVNRLAGDVNRLFRGISTSSIHVTEDSRTLRRALLDFYAMGYTHTRPTLECWQSLLQLLPEQSFPLRATLRALNSEDRYEQRFLEPPSDPPNTLFGEECDVSGAETVSRDALGPDGRVLADYVPGACLAGTLEAIDAHKRRCKADTCSLVSAYTLVPVYLHGKYFYCNQIF